MISANLNLSQEIYPGNAGECLLFPATGNVLHMAGREALDLLQRISTNNLVDLQDNSSRYTILVTEKARIVDLLLVHRLGKENILLISSPGQSERVHTWISKFIIMEDISINDVSTSHLVYTLILSDGNSRNIRDATSVDTSGSTICFLDPLWNSMAVYQMLDEGDRNAESIRSSRGLRLLTADQFEELRIIEGVPAFGKELTEQFNPLEAGLNSLISFSKGCYVGQEVIARIDTYKKLQRSLCGFWVDSPEQISLAGPHDIILGGKSVGLITSLQWSDRHKKCVALGYLNTDIPSEEFDLPRADGRVYKLHKRVLPGKGTER